MNRSGLRQPDRTQETGWCKPFRTRPEVDWMIADQDDRPMGYFTIIYRTAHAVISAAGSSPMP
jgi:hypothetical protein